MRIWSSFSLISPRGSLQRLRISGNHGEKIVKIVGDASRQASHRFHAGGFLEFFLHQAALPNVANNAVIHQAVAEGALTGADFDGNRSAVDVADHQIPGVQVRGAMERGDLAPEQLPLPRADQAGHRNTGQLRKLGVGVENDSGIVIGDDDRVAGGLKQMVVVFVGFPRSCDQAVGNQKPQE